MHEFAHRWGNVLQINLRNASSPSPCHKAPLCSLLPQSPTAKGVTPGCDFSISEVLESGNTSLKETQQNSADSTTKQKQWKQTNKKAPHNSNSTTASLETISKTVTDRTIQGEITESSIEALCSWEQAKSTARAPIPWAGWMGAAMQQWYGTLKWALQNPDLSLQF